MPVIAMNQEMGSQGKLVAEKLAEELGLEIVRHEVIDHVAQTMHMRKSALQRFLEAKSGLLERRGTDEASLALSRSRKSSTWRPRATALLVPTAVVTFPPMPNALSSAPWGR